jgi:uncharacterized protein YbaP (TraB family)
MLRAPLSRLLRLLPLAALPLAALGVALTAPQASADPAADRPAQDRAEDAQPRDRPFLWRIDGGQKASYLFGTIHTGVQASELHAVVDRALHISDLFVMETAPKSGQHAHQPANQNPVNQNAVLGTPMDLSLAQHARDIGKPVATLESMAFQLSLLAQVGSAEELVAMLAEDPGAIEPLIAAYRSGDLEQIATLTQLEDARTQELLLDSRNRRWVHKLTPALKRGGVFTAVGVGHAPGEQGLLQLLRAQGYTLRQYGV